MANQDRRSEAIGLHIAELRKAAGFSLAELAARAGTDPGSLSAFERGLKIPRVRTILPILAALGCGVVSDHTIPGRRIRLFRQMYLLSRSELGKLVQASWEQIYEWERGEIVPSLAALRRFCRAFGVGLDFFFAADNADELIAERRMAAMANIGGRIRDLAAARGLSLREVGRRAGFKWNTLWRMLDGRRRPQGRTLLRIARVLGIGMLTLDRARIEPEFRRPDPFTDAPW